MPSFDHRTRECRMSGEKEREEKNVYLPQKENTDHQTYALSHTDVTLRFNEAVKISVEEFFFGVLNNVSMFPIHLLRRIETLRFPIKIE